VKARPLTTKSAASLAVGTLLCVSLAANFYLAAYLILYSQTRAGRSGFIRASAEAFQEPLQKKHVSIGGRTPFGAPGTEMASILPFCWSDIESADFRQYIANLRAVGCPEATVRDIVTADVGQLFSARAAEIWKRSSPLHYWQKPDGEGPNGRQMRELNKLAREQTSVLQELLERA
jgi:hypothetical protein